MELSRHIKEHRVRLGMSQEQLAEAIYVSRQTISNWETDRTYPDVQSLLLLSNLFDVSVDALIKGDVEKMNAVLSAEAKKLNKLSIVMVVSGVVALVWTIVTALMDVSLPIILVPAILFFIPAVISAGIVEKIKNDNQLYSYRSIEAFMRGENPDVLSERNQKAGNNWWIKLAVKIVIGVAVGFCCGWGFMSILEKVLN